MVWYPQQIIDRNLLILQIQIKDQPRAGGSRAGENDFRKDLLDDDNQSGNQRKTGQNISNRGIHSFSQRNHRDTGEKAVNIEDNVRGDDQRSLCIPGSEA